MLLLQSALIPHVLLSAHFGQVGPPQSTSVSLPFLIPSMQVAVAAAQTPELQLLLLQSALTRQALPFAHFEVQLPPQSTSVSSPFFTVSVQVGSAHPVICAGRTSPAQGPHSPLGAHVRLPLLHTPTLRVAGGPL
jgi:hypothetical protein